MTARTSKITPEIYSPERVHEALSGMVEHTLKLSVMIWGPPGIGKSSVVAQVAAGAGMQLIDLRLSQLAPTDLRGLPVADHEAGVARWYPPEFLPREGKGILFLDEINMAPPSLQGIAQQLVLDRRVGSYSVPDGWFIWAAGNRKEDYASVFDMPSPLANRFVHFNVGPDFDSFKVWAMRNGIEESVVAFLAYRPNLLHKMDAQQPAWPSPRAWAMASVLHGVGLDIAPAVGLAAATEFQAYLALVKNLPDLGGILSGKGKTSFPEEPSVRYAVAIGLAMRARNADETLRALKWMIGVAPAEWVQLFGTDMMRLARERGHMAELAKGLKADPKAAEFFTQFRSLIGLG